MVGAMHIELMRELAVPAAVVAAALQHEIAARQIPSDIAVGRYRVPVVIEDVMRNLRPRARR